MRVVKPGVLVLGWNTVIKLIRFEKQAFCLHFSVLGVWGKKIKKIYSIFYRIKFSGASLAYIRHCCARNKNI